jgi:hypothetical protein
MTPRSLVVLLLLVATASASEPDVGKPMSRRELKKFLGPVSPNLISWHKDITRDAESYYGTANPPLAGSVSIELWLETWKPDLGTLPPVGGSDKLGIVSGRWSTGEHESVYGEYSAHFSYADTSGRTIGVHIKSPVESDVQILKKEISRLPMFNLPSGPFHDVVVRKQIERFVDWLLLPSLFVISIWLPDRYLCKKRVSGLGRTLTLAAISVIWILLFMGLVLIRLRTDWYLLLVPAMALIALIASVLVVLCLLVRRLIRSMFATRV